MMNKKNFYQKNSALIRKYKKNKLGFLETVQLTVSGYVDGLRELPMVNAEGLWLSPFMVKEKDAYDKFCSSIWTDLQMENKDLYAKAEESADKMHRLEAALKEARKGLHDAVCVEEDVEVVRKTGEDQLTEEQVKRRRKQEKMKRFTPLVNNIKDLEEQVGKEVDKLIKIYPKLSEDIETTKMLCDCGKEHMKQRLDVYWNAALYKHPNHASMPAGPGLIPETGCKAQEIYLEKHEKLLEKTKGFRACETVDMQE